MRALSPLMHTAAPLWPNPQVHAPDADIDMCVVAPRHVGRADFFDRGKPWTLQVTHDHPARVYWTLFKVAPPSPHVMRKHRFPTSWVPLTPPLLAGHALVFSLLIVFLLPCVFQRRLEEDPYASELLTVPEAYTASLGSSRCLAQAIFFLPSFFLSFFFFFPPVLCSLVERALLSLLHLLVGTLACVPRFSP